MTALNMLARSVSGPPFKEKFPPLSPEGKGLLAAVGAMWVLATAWTGMRIISRNIRKSAYYAEDHLYFIGFVSLSTMDDCPHNLTGTCLGLVQWLVHHLRAWYGRLWSIFRGEKLIDHSHLCRRSGKRYWPSVRTSHVPLYSNFNRQPDHVRRNALLHQDQSGCYDPTCLRRLHVRHPSYC